MRTLLFSAVFALACTPDGTTRGAPGGGDIDTADTGDTEDPLPQAEGCRATPRDPSAPRVLLANLPYQGDGSQWAVVDIAADDAVSDRGDRVQAGRAAFGRGASTPDGSLLLAPQDDGTLAVFGVDEAGAITVVEAGWSDGTYTSGVTIDPSGEVAWLTNESRSDVGGGVTAVVLDCDTGRPRLATPDDGLAVDASGLLLAADHPRAFLPVPWALDRAVLVGRPVDGAETTDAALVSLPDGAIVAEVDAFGPDAWLSAAAISADGQTLVIGDASAWSGRDNAVAQVAVSPDHSLTLLGTVDVYDPADVALSPDGGAALVASGFGDDLLFVALGDAGPALDGRVSASGDRPQLPGGLVAVDRGGDAALVLASEVYGLRRIEAVSASGMQPSAVVALDGDATPGLVVLQR